MQTVRQAFTILKQNPLLSTISILGTAFAITMIMAIVIIWQTKYADLEPEVNRSRCLYFSAMHISSKTEEGVELRIKIPEGEDKLVITDSVRLKQVVNNLINNAKKFTVTGSITFGYVTNREGYTTIFVEDTGSGISEDAQKHIFERFYKEDSFTQGAGLGLSICQTIVDRLHGSISVSSELGKGTRFEVVIPDANE